MCFEIISFIADKFEILLQISRSDFVAVINTLCQQHILEYNPTAIISDVKEWDIAEHEHPIACFQKTYGVNFLSDTHHQFNISPGHVGEFNILGKAITEHNNRLVKKLLALGANYNAPVAFHCKDKTIISFNALIASVAYRNDWVTQFLLKEYSPNLLYQNESGESVLMTAVTYNNPMYNLILETAKKQKIFDELVLLQNKNGNLCYQYAKTGNLSLKAKALGWILECEDFVRDLDLEVLLADLRINSWNTTRIKAEELINKLRGHITSREPVIKVTPSVELIYNALYGEAMPKTLTSKTQAVQFAIARFSYLLESPERCFTDYFQRLNRELIRYYEEKGIRAPKLEKDKDYYFITSCSFPFPYPKWDKGLEKNRKKHALQELLILIMRQAGIDVEVYRWFELLPQSVTNASIQKGHFIIEDKYGPLLHHGPLSHGLQTFLLLLSEMDSPTTYFLEGVEHKLELKAIIDGFITLKNTEGRLLWDIVRDDIRWHRTFSVPQRLGSMMMFEGAKYGCRELADYCIEMHIRAILKLYKAMKQIQEYRSLTLDSFCRDFSDLDPTVLSFIDIFYRYSQKKCLEKFDQDLITFDGRKAVMVNLTKHYNPNRLFQPNLVKASHNNNNANEHLVISK